MLLGAHVSTQGGITQAVERAHKLGCNTLQIFSRNPQSWRNNFLKPEDIGEFIRLRKKFKIGPVFIHVPYLINLASPNPKLYWASVRAYVEDIQEAEKLKADYIVTHMGSHKETTEEAGLKRLSAALNKIISKTKDSPVGILLENTTGSGSWLGYKFVHQKKVISRLKDKSRVGLCLDTAHAYLAGYDISTGAGLKKLLDEIEENVGLNLIRLIHLNDAPGKLGSRHDTHTHIGKGNIGLEGMRGIINHFRLRDIPFILETPKETLKDDRMNLNTVRKLRAGD
ncbi:MAG: deoxyribonuclease IV [Candidatus Omnitrophota bacterium]